LWCKENQLLRDENRKLGEENAVLKEQLAIQQRENQEKDAIIAKLEKEVRKKPTYFTYIAFSPEKREEQGTSF